MTSENINIGEAELEIMKVLWKAGEPVNLNYITKAVASKNWKRTTISTYLTRLADKGAILAEKQAGLYFYSPLISAKEYRKSQTKKLVKRLYNGSIKELAVSLFEDEKLSAEDLRELRAIFDEKEL